MADPKKQLAYNIVEFLRTSAQDGTVKEDDKESLEVAVQVINEAFGVDPDSAEDQAAYSIKPASLLQLLDVLTKTKSKTASAAAAPAAAATPVAAASSGPTPSEKAKAEQLKTKGNMLMGKKDYDAAIVEYTAAIALDPNPVFYSNRAAAWGGLGKHEEAAEDAERAIELDPKFAKGFSRLGHAQFSQGEYQKAIDAYESGLKLDPTNANMKSSLATAKTRLAEQTSTSVSDREPAPGAGAGAGGMPDLSALAGMFGGGGAGGAGGMPDIASMMRNPQMMAMAQQMMANGGLERLMSNPALRGMAENMQNGGGMPDFNALAQDPAMRDLASQFMGGQGGQGQ